MADASRNQPLMPTRIRGGDSKFKFRTGIRKWMSVSETDVGLWFLTVCVVMTGCHGYQEQRFAIEPQDQNTIIGSRVTFPCRVEHKVGTLQWTKDGFGLGTHRNLSDYERYTMIGSDEEGDYSLEIRNITVEDDAVFQCQVSTGPNGEPAIRSRNAVLTVLVAPEPPRIIQGAFIDATEGQTLDIQCVSERGKPAAEITWLDGDQVIRKHVKSETLRSEDGDTFTTRSTLRLTPSKDNHNHTFTCQAQNSADRAHRMTTVHIEVKYTPKITLTLKSALPSDDGQEYIREGTEARITCDVDANPRPQLYRWYINDNPVIGDYTNELVLFNATKKYNNAEVKCEVSNTIGKTAKTMTLKVTYPPSFITYPVDVEADIGKEVTLRCDVTSQPPPEIIWLLHEPGREGVKGKRPELKFEVTNDTAGRYICKASVNGYEDIEAEATVLIKGVPRIISNRTQLGIEGDMVTVDCAAVSVPKPVDIRWYFKGKEISIDPDVARTEESFSNGIVKYSLVIRNSKPEHFGAYNCSITNENGHVNAEIVLKPMKTLPIVIILIGSASGIVMVSFFTAMLVLCNRKRRNNKMMNEKPDVTATTTDMYKESDRSSNISDLKPQLPGGDGSYDLDYSSSDTSSKLKGGLSLAGPVSLPLRYDDPLLQFRYSNDYSDPAYSDHYLKNLQAYMYDYPQGYVPPPNLRVQSPVQDPNNGNRSLQGSLTRSIDTASTVQLSNSNGSQNNSLKRTSKSIDEIDAYNSLGLPVSSEVQPTPVYGQSALKTLGNNGIDVRYAATYGNPYLRNSAPGFGGQVHSAKPASAMAPPPYTSIRSSVVIPTGNATQGGQATHV